ncbi:MAG: DUF1998 domain-containing protein [Verrucomicrobiae bacterium]|nr:DUF1998 domain-containing protein [Verrucomicrobiae bacterium]
MAIQQLRTSQLITTFGTGSMVDLPEASVIIGGPDHWVYREDEIADHLIREDRLSKRIAQYLNEIFDYNLQDVQLRRPPRMRSALQYQGLNPEVVAWKFPEWYVVQQIEETPAGKRRRLVNKHLLDKGKFRDENGKRQPVVPIRFVRACDKGHVDDIDWLTYVHGVEERNCVQAQGGLFLLERGSSGALADIIVSCNCGRNRSLALARKDKTILGYCNGRRPWLGPLSKERCVNKANHRVYAKLLVRSASNAYFPQLYSVISIPEGSSGLPAVLKKYQADLTKVTSVELLAMARQFNGNLDKSLGDHSDQEVFDALTKMRNHSTDQAVSTKTLEFAALTGPTSNLADDQVEGDFLIRHLDDELWKSDPLLSSCLEKVVLVDRLREVVAQVGFTRFESRGTNLDGELDLDLQPAPLAKDKTNIIPAFENRGEGVFLQFKPDQILAWSRKSAVQARADALNEGFSLKVADRGQESLEFHGVSFYMLHTLAHLLIQEIALECGYPTSSLKERIYCDAPKNEFGILIYTGSSDAEGTLGGLVNSAKRIQPIMLNTIHNASICSSDPVCAHTKPEPDNPSHWLLGSACHCCTHLPETSCEQMNQFLDRALVVPTLAGYESEFFSLTQQ